MFLPKRLAYRRTCIALTLFTLMIAPAAFSQDDDMDFTSMSLEDLLNVEVSVATSKAESIIETPAVVSRYERADLEKMGLRTIDEIISFIPGLTVNKTLLGTTAFQVRGAVEGFNQKVLVLIDGVPYWQPSHSDNAAIGGVPFEAVSHVEVIRGPGAVIYGSNAAGGVINIVTKTDEDKKVALTRGSNALYNGSAYLGHKFENEATLAVSFEAQRDDGYLTTIQGNPNPGAGLPGEGPFRKFEEWESLYVRYKAGNFNAMLQTFEANTHGLGGVGTIINTNRLQYKGSFLHLNHTFKGDNWSINPYAEYMIFFPTFNVANALGLTTDGGFRFEDGASDNHKYRLGSTFSVDINDNFNFFGGAEYELRSTSAYQLFNRPADATLLNLIESDTTDEVAAFAQLDYTMGDWRFLLGARYVDNEKAGDDINPRASVVYKLNDANSLKFLYSTGFNSPNFLQTNILLPGTLFGNPNLAAEKITTTDIVWTYNQDNTLFVANAFFYTAEDFIERQVGEGGITFVNGPEVDRYGLELDYQKAASFGKIFANVSYLAQGDDVDADDPLAVFAPQFMANVGMRYKVAEGHSLGGSVRYMGSRIAVDSYTNLHLHYVYEHNNFQFNLTARNAIDDDIYHSDVANFTRDRKFSGADDMNLYAGIKLAF